MGGLQVGLLDLITAGRPSADSFTRAGYLAAVDACMEPWTMLGKIAARNRLARLPLGICVTDAGRRNPAVGGDGVVVLPGGARDQEALTQMS